MIEDAFGVHYSLSCFSCGRYPQGQMGPVVAPPAGWNPVRTLSWANLKRCSDRPPSDCLRCSSSEDGRKHRILAPTALHEVSERWIPARCFHNRGCMLATPSYSKLNVDGYARRDTAGNIRPNPISLRPCFSPCLCTRQVVHQDPLPKLASAALRSRSLVVCHFAVNERSSIRVRYTNKDRVRSDCPWRHPQVD